MDEHGRTQTQGQHGQTRNRRHVRVRVRVRPCVCVRHCSSVLVPVSVFITKLAPNLNICYIPPHHKIKKRHKNEPHQNNQGKLT